MADIHGLAYQIEEAYRKTKTHGEAIEMVKNKNEDADLNILWAMWLAIDAYVDVNENK